MKKAFLLIFFSVFLNFQAIAKDRVYGTGTLLGIENSVINGPTVANVWGNTIIETTNETKVFSMAIAIKDLIYIANYEAKWRWSDHPDFVIGDPIQVALDGNNLYLKRNDGKKDFKAKIIKKVRNEQKQANQGL